MHFKLPPKFERDTSWLYVKGGVEYGPVTASKLLELMDNHTVESDTVLCELNTGRRGKLNEIKVFAEYLSIVAKQDEIRKADEEFEESTKKMAAHNRPLIIGFAVGVPLIIGAILAAIFWPRPKADVDERPSQMAVPTSIDPTFTKAGSISSGGPMEAEEPDLIAQRVAPTEAQLDDYLKQKLKNENQLATAGQVDLAARKKVEAEAAEAKKKANKKKKSEGGAQGAAAEENVLDFGGDEMAVDAAPTNSKATAQRRLDKALRECTQQAFKSAGFQGTATVLASIRLNSDGRLDNLQVQVEGGGPSTDVRMCLSAELPNMQVPPFQGDSEKLYSDSKFKGE